MDGKEINLIEKPIEYEDEKTCRCGECGNVISNVKKPKLDKLWPNPNMQVDDKD